MRVPVAVIVGQAADAILRSLREMFIGVSGLGLVGVVDDVCQAPHAWKNPDDREECRSNPDPARTPRDCVQAAKQHEQQSCVCCGVQRQKIESSDSLEHGSATSLLIDRRELRMNHLEPVSITDFPTIDSTRPTARV